MDEIEKITLRDEVFIDLARAAMVRVNNLAEKLSATGVTGFLRVVLGRNTPEITVQQQAGDEETETPGRVTYGLKIAVYYGSSIPETVRHLRQAITEEVESITGYQVERIDVLVERWAHYNSEVTEETSVEP
ncbi:MAG TPA: Asp23/Gls24 family envelope stress response protein [Patescibacteria group bacterium]|nr:Asp23/Gls24 family envelope stress response protein [Patescibacteria group bacterium]